MKLIEMRFLCHNAFRLALEELLSILVALKIMVVLNVQFEIITKFELMNLH